jgi:hypothetical protein
MLVGVLMKTVAIAIVLSVLLYCYSLIMGTSDAALPWALKILMIALVTVAVFIYRKPFTHLFSAVGYGTLGSSERAEVSLREAGFTFRRSTLDAATLAIPGVAGYRAARWARRNPGQAAAVAAGVAGGVGAGTAAVAATAGEAATGTGTGPGAASDAYASRFRPDAPPAADGDSETSPGSRRGASAASLSRNRNMPEADGASGRTAPPLDLPPRPGGGPGGSGPASAGSSWSRGAGRSAAPGPAPSRSRATSGGAPGLRSAPPANGTNGNGGTGSRQSAPAWPHKPASAGWTGASSGAGPRQRPATERRPAAPRPPQAGESAPAGGSGTEEPRAMPFWLRPMRRDK